MTQTISHEFRVLALLDDRRVGGYDNIAKMQFDWVYPTLTGSILLECLNEVIEKWLGYV